MEAVNTFIKHSTNHFSSSFFLFHFPSLSLVNRKFLNISNKKRSQLPGMLNSSSFKISEASVQSMYGGWDDLKPIGDSAQPGQSNHLCTFLASIGIDDTKQIYMFLLGICCALAISRVRAKSNIVFPAFILVFGIGFSLGFLGSGSGSGGRYGELVVTKRRGGEKSLRDYNETLMKFLDGFEVKLSNLKDDVQKAIGMNKITVDELKNYTDLIVSMRLSCLDARKIIDVTVAGVGNSNGVLAENQKSSRKKKELDDDGFGLFPFVRSLFREVLVILESNKLKDKGIVVNNQTQENISTSAFQKTSVNLVEEKNANENKQFNYSNSSSNGRFINMGVNARIKMDIENKEYSYRHKELEFISDNSFNSKIDRNDLNDKMDSHDSLDFRISSGRIKKKAAYMMVQEQIHSNYNGENETYTSRFRETINVEDNSILDNNISDDVAFDRCLAEANDLLNKAKEYITAKHDEDNAEIVLHKSAKLLSKAVIMKPKSLLAVGQLGNTYLLHGELKLKITRQLRAILSSTDSFGKTFKGFEDRLASKENVASVLVKVCEECEELLVEAGRKYKAALSIDADDVRALYNWGLALSFRAQLIADIGPEAAFDADRIFLAATDKFDAMMSKGNVYASEALFRWGMTLQQRSRLRPITSKERLKLLQQAKRLYEDSLHEDSNNFPVKEALASCISELKCIRF